MSATSPCMLHLRGLINSCQSTDIDKIWMTVSGDGDFTMANVLGLFIKQINVYFSKYFLKVKYWVI